MSKTIVITGTSSGVGLALGNYFHSRGYLVIGLSRSIPENSNFITIPTDITKEAEVELAFQQILKVTNRIDILINNAGRGMVGPATDATEEEILSLFNLNLVSVVRIIKRVIPLMKNKQGKIFNISSIGSLMGLPFRGYYSASKSALDMVTESLRYELIRFNIQVSTINLGDVRTSIAEGRIKSAVSIDYQKDYNKVYEAMNMDVDKGFEPNKLAPFLEKLIKQKSKLKPHYYFGTFTQKLSVILKAILPQMTFEKIIASYSGMGHTNKERGK